MSESYYSVDVGKIIPHSSISVENNLSTSSFDLADINGQSCHWQIWIILSADHYNLNCHRICIFQLALASQDAMSIESQEATCLTSLRWWRLMNFSAGGIGRYILSRKCWMTYKLLFRILTLLFDQSSWVNCAMRITEDLWTVSPTISIFAERHANRAENITNYRTKMDQLLLGNLCRLQTFKCLNGRGNQHTKYHNM